MRWDCVIKTYELGDMGYLSELSVWLLARLPEFESQQQRVFSSPSRVDRFSDPVGCLLVDYFSGV
jgi:hypothetical protein